jgi:hypothetical protein
MFIVALVLLRDVYPSNCQPKRRLPAHPMLQPNMLSLQSAEGARYREKNLTND